MKNDGLPVHVLDCMVTYATVCDHWSRTRVCLGFLSSYNVHIHVRCLPFHYLWLLGSPSSCFTAIVYRLLVYLHTCMYICVDRVFVLSW